VHGFAPDKYRSAANNKNESSIWRRVGKIKVLSALLPTNKNYDYLGIDIHYTAYAIESQF
jgi:hypothetical protein